MKKSKKQEPELNELEHSEPEDYVRLTKREIIKERKKLKEYFGIDFFMESPSMEELETHAIEVLVHDAKEPDSTKRKLTPLARKTLLRFVRNN